MSRESFAMRLYKRGSRWWVDNSTNGIRSRRPLGKEITTEAQANRFIRELKKADLEKRLLALDPSQTTLGDFADQYLKERVGHVAESTLRRDRFALQALRKDLGEKALLRSLTARKVDQWATLRLSTGVSPGAVNADLRHIRKALNTAQAWGIVEKSPAVKLVKVGKRLPRHLAPEAVEQIIAVEADPELKRLWSFLVWTGLRRAEALRLAWPDITWGDKPFCRVVGKGDKERLVPLLPATVEALGEKKDIGHCWTQYHPDHISHRFKVAAQAAGHPAKLHDLRHTCLTWLVSRGVNLKLVQQIAGHSSIQTTMLYAQAFAGDLYDEMSKAER